MISTSVNVNTINDWKKNSYILVFQTLEKQKENVGLRDDFSVAFLCWFQLFFLKKQATLKSTTEGNILILLNQTKKKAEYLKWFFLYFFVSATRRF